MNENLLLKLYCRGLTIRAIATALGKSPNYINQYILHTLKIKKSQMKARPGKDHLARVCLICGKKFEIFAWSNNKGEYCSKRCWGIKIGRDYGFRRHDLPMQEIIKKHTSGRSIYSLAREYGISPGCISERLKKLGIPTSRQQH